MRFLVFVGVLLFSSISYGQCVYCQSSQVRATVTRTRATTSAPIWVESTQVVPVQRVVTEYVETKVQTAYVPVMVETFDVDCGLAIAQDFLACSANATTRRERFRCAFTAALNNIDCIVGGFSPTSSVGSGRRVLFPRMAARRTARQIVRTY